MAGNPKQKQKILYLAKILTEQTDEQHPMTVAELRQALAERGISSERKSVSCDLEQLTAFGLDIQKVRSREVRYYLANRGLDAADLELLTDLLKLSRQVPQKRRLDLERKLKRLFSVWRRSSADRELAVFSSAPPVSERVYSNVELLRDSIVRRKKIVFRYHTVLPAQKGQYRKGLALCRVSPYRLVYADGHYSLVGENETEGGLSFFEVEKMREIFVTDESRTDIRAAVGDIDFDLEQYIRGYFGEENGAPLTLGLRFHRSLLPIIDRRFSSDAVIAQIDDEIYSLTAEECLSSELLEWLLRHGGSVRVTAPAMLAEKMRQLSEELYETYHEATKF